MQQSGLGGPYASISTETLVATALNDPASGPLGVGTAPPADADGYQVFTGNHILPVNGDLFFNCYISSTQLATLSSGPVGSFTVDPTGAFTWNLGSGLTDQAPVTSQVMNLSMAGALTLPYGTLTVARDPAAQFEVATMGWVGNNTVKSFNQRNGQVQLNASDVYSALKLTDPLATQPWVNQAITNSLQNLLWTCPFVNTWNGRKGSVYLMLSDITCVFYQSGQQPISPTPAAGSNDDSIATTQFVQELFAGGTGAFLPLAGGTISPGPLTVSNAAINADGVVITPIGMYQSPPPGSLVPFSTLQSFVNIATSGGSSADQVTTAGYFNATVYGAPNNYSAGLSSVATYASTAGGQGQNVGAYIAGSRNSAASHTTTTVSVTLAAPSNTIQVADVSMVPCQYDIPILINGNPYMQVGVSGTSGPGSITCATQISVADGTAGNTVAGNNNPQVFGANIFCQDITGLDSQATNVDIGTEIDLFCNGFDNAGSGGEGVRSVLSLLAMQQDPAGTGAEVATGVSIGIARNAWFKRAVSVWAPFSEAAFETRSATQLTGANAIWLADGHSVSWNTAGTALTWWDSSIFAGAGGVHLAANLQVDGTLFVPNDATIGTAFVSGNGNVSGELQAGLSGADVIVGSQTNTPLTATTGYLVVPYCVGTPTATPVNNSRGIALVFDVQTDHLWAFVGGSWKSALFS